MLIKGAAILQDGHLIKDRDIRIEGSRISATGHDLSSSKRDEEVIDARGKLALPGLVNCHTHLAMTLMRGYADDMELQPWLEEKIWPLEGRLRPEDIRAGVRLGCLELIRFGVTSFNDMYLFPDAVAEAAKEMGMRGFVSGVVFDFRPEFLADVEPFMRRWEKDDLIRPAVGPHSVYACSEETLLKEKEIADLYNAMIHIHVSETREEADGFNFTKGMSPVEYLNSLGMVNERLAAVHCVWLSENDCQILAERKANVVDCTVSNLKLTSGIAPLNTLMKYGVNVCLGTDGASSNNNLNMFEDMKVTAIAQKNAYHSPAAFTAEQIWQIATGNAYRAFGLDMGIRAGALADVILIDLHKPWMCPQTNIVSHLVYSMTGEVDTTIVNGRVLMREGTVDGEEKILEEAQKCYEDLVARS